MNTRLSMTGGPLCLLPDDDANAIIGENGIIALKGGDIHDELNGITEKRILDIKNIFDIQYFCDKKIVYIPSSSI